MHCGIRIIGLLGGYYVATGLIAVPLAKGVRGGHRGQAGVVARLAVGALVT